MKLIYSNNMHLKITLLPAILPFLYFQITSGKTRPGPAQVQYGWRITPAVNPWRYNAPGGSPMIASEHGDLSLPYTYRSSRRAGDGYNATKEQSVSIRADSTSQKRETNYWSSYYGSNNYKCGFTCDDGTCLRSEQRCDGYAQCWDGTDEKGCHCKDLINEDKICDGYRDCPDGGDEHDCVYGCQANEFTCDITNTGSKVKCIPMSKRCDGYADCPLQNDEHDCYRMVDLHDDSYQARGYRSHGILQKRVGHQWHTICKVSGTNQHIEAYATKACQHASGYTDGPIAITAVSLSQLKKKMTQQQAKELKYVKIAEVEAEFSVIGTCASDYAYKVECPSPQCGGLGNQDQNRRRRRSIAEDDEDLADMEDDPFFDFGNDDDIESDDLHLIVGGYNTEEMSWPFLVGIFRDGEFYCGGSIINENWIMTAAHCCHGYDKHTYEVQAGMTRRYSWSPYEQTRHVEDIYVHEEYNSKIFANDIALYKLDRPLYLSKYVTPACLPEGKEDDPKANQYCKVAGWGDLSESGSGPDHMQEVSLPIMGKCQESFTRDAYQICAGYKEGGKDACQGDSGGPLLCTNSDGRPIVSGVVSFGRGCARENEAGAYTRVSAYLDWIQKIISGSYSHPSYYPRPKQCVDRCHKPAGECMYAEEKCSGKVECLDAKDELDCTHLVTRAHQTNYPNSMNMWSGYPQPQQKMYGLSRSASGSSGGVGGGAAAYPYPYNYFIPTPTYVTPSQPSSSIGYRARSVHSQPTHLSFSSVPHLKPHVSGQPSTSSLSRKTILECHENEIKCGVDRTGVMNECIKSEHFCDGIQHCTDGSDEQECFGVVLKDFSEPLKPSAKTTATKIEGFIIARMNSQNWQFLTMNQESWTLSHGVEICNRMKSSSVSTATLDSLENIQVSEFAARAPSAKHLLHEDTQVIHGDSSSVIVTIINEADRVDEKKEQGFKGFSTQKLHEIAQETTENSNPVVIGYIRCSFS